MTRRVLAVASSGGHWQQLSELSEAFDALELLRVGAGTSDQCERADYRVSDCNQNTPFRALICLFQLAALMIRLRPALVVSTGALPGAIALVLGRTIGAKTVWIDSVANAETLSMSGRFVRPFAQLHLSQWPDVAKQDGCAYAGNLL